MIDGCVHSLWSSKAFRGVLTRGQALSLSHWLGVESKACLSLFRIDTGDVIYLNASSPAPCSIRTLRFRALPNPGETTLLSRGGFPFCRDERTGRETGAAVRGKGGWTWHFGGRSTQQIGSSRSFVVS